MSQTIFYDGASRPRSEVISRIEADAGALASKLVQDFTDDDSPWEVLLETVEIPSGVDELSPEILSGPPTISWSMRVTFHDGRVSISVPRHFPKRLAAMHAAFSAKPWCASATVRGSTLTMSLANLDPGVASRIVARIKSRAERHRAQLRRGIDALRAVIHPDVSPSITMTLDHALAEIDRIEEAKTNGVGSLAARSS